MATETTKKLLRETGEVAEEDLEMYGDFVEGFAKAAFAASMITDVPISTLLKKVSPESEQ